ncbi:MAG: HigA family addiction module antitoxin [Bryobacteraceae bacterium]
MTAPVHPGLYIRQNIIPATMAVKDAAKLLGVGRPALSNLLNGNAALSPEMATRLEKAFGADPQKLLKLQADYDKVDPKRIYATGMSNGGGMTNRVGCDMATAGALSASSV